MSSVTGMRTVFLLVCFFFAAAAARAELVEARVGQTVTLTAQAEGTAPFIYQWYRGAKKIQGQYASTLVLSNLKATDAGAYSVVIANSAGRAHSSKVVLRVLAAGPLANPPKVSSSPNAAEGGFSLATDVAEVSAFFFQWFVNGILIPDQIGPTLGADITAALGDGLYQVALSNDNGTVWSAPLEVATARSAPSRLINFSIRSAVESASSPLIIGLTTKGTGEVPVLVRAAGPTLRNFGISDAIEDPQVTLYSGADVVEENDDWGEAGLADLYSPLFLKVGAFPFLSPTSFDAAVIYALSGSCTVHVAPRESTPAGVTLFEAYDVARSGKGTLSNLAAQTLAGAGNKTLIVGFVIEGDQDMRLLIRGIGPALTAFGVANALSDPVLRVYRNETLIASNDNWGGAAELSALFTQAGAFSLKNSSKDAALSIKLSPGAYTAHVVGKQAETGRAMVELYSLE